MKFLADESVDMPVFLHLKEKGFVIDHVSFISSGIDDESVLKYAYSNKRVLITVDKDFGDLAFKFKKPSFGVVLYRLEGLSNKDKASIVEEVLRKFLSKLEGNFTVISDKQVRIKKIIS